MITVGEPGDAVHEKVQPGVDENAVVFFPRFSTVVYQRGEETPAVRLRVRGDHGLQIVLVQPSQRLKTRTPRLHTEILKTARMRNDIVKRNAHDGREYRPPPPVHGTRRTYRTFGGSAERVDPPVGVFRAARSYVQSCFLVVFFFQSETVHFPRVRRRPHYCAPFHINHAQRMPVLKTE